MAPKNTGKPSEKLFRTELVKRFGKNFYLDRRVDNAGIVGRSGGRQTSISIVQPADFMLTDPVHGLHYAEVKSTIHDELRRTAFRPGQLQAAERAEEIRPGSYIVYIQQVITGNWYILPGRELYKGAKHWKIKNLQPWL